MEYLTDRLIPRSEDRVSAVNYATSVMKDESIDQVRKVIVVDPKWSMMLQNVSIQSLSYD